MTIKDFDSDGFPRLSNLGSVIKDLRGLRKEISESKDKTKERPYIQLPGFVAEVIEEQERAVVVVPRENVVVHSFEIAQGYVPGGNLKSLRINEEVFLRVFSQTDGIEVGINDLTDEEIKNKPKEWKVKEGEDKFLVSACLEDKVFESWHARPEAIDYLKRRSWQYCLHARIAALKERLSGLKEMDLAEGTIQKIDYGADGKTVKSAQVVISGDVPGFVFGSDLGSLLVSIGDRIPFYIRAVDPNTGFLRLVAKHIEDERRRRQEEFVKRTEENIQRWENNIRRARENIAKNKARPVRTKEFQDRVQLWIAEDERKIRDWLDKVESARRRLKD